jgi:hypothetical protein
MTKEHAHGRKNYVLEINAILTLEAVERLFFQDSARGFETTRMVGTSMAPAVSYRTQDL